MGPLDAFAANVKRIRNEKGLTQERLAEQADLKLSDIAKIETRRRSPGIQVIAKIAYGLGVPTSALMKDVEYNGGDRGPA